MFISECSWVSEALQNLDDADLFPLINVGSSTLKYRTRDYPYIESVLFGPLVARGGPVWHQDMKNGPGVDVVGDLLDPKVEQQLQGLGARTILCNGCLLHVRDLDRACQVLSQLVPAGGFLCISTPEVYPFCSDPWDSGFRPTPQHLSQLFPELTVLAQSSVVQCDDSYFLSLCRDPRAAFMFVARLFTPFWKPRNWLGLIRSLPDFFKPYRAACVLMRKPA